MVPADADGYTRGELAAQPIDAETDQDTRDVQNYIVHIGDPAEKILQRFNADDPTKRPEKNRSKTVTFRVHEREQYADRDKQQHVARKIQQRHGFPIRGIRTVLPKEPNRAERDEIRRGAWGHIRVKIPFTAVSDTDQYAREHRLRHDADDQHPKQHKACLAPQRRAPPLALNEQNAARQIHRGSDRHINQCIADVAENHVLHLFQAALPLSERVHTTCACQREQKKKQGYRKNGKKHQKEYSKATVCALRFGGHCRLMRGSCRLSCLLFGCCFCVAAAGRFVCLYLPHRKPYVHADKRDRHDEGICAPIEVQTRKILGSSASAKQTMRKFVISMLVCSEANTQPTSAHMIA